MNLTCHVGILRNVADFTSPKGYTSTVITLEISDRQFVKGGGTRQVTRALEYHCFGRMIDVAKSLPGGSLVSIKGKVDASQGDKKIFMKLVAEQVDVLMAGANIPTKTPQQEHREQGNPDEELPF